MLGLDFGRLWRPLFLQMKDISEFHGIPKVDWYYNIITIIILLFFPQLYKSTWARCLRRETSPSTTWMLKPVDIDASRGSNYKWWIRSWAPSSFARPQAVPPKEVWWVAERTSLGPKPFSFWMWIAYIEWLKTNFAQGTRERRKVTTFFAANCSVLLAKRLIDPVTWACVWLGLSWEMMVQRKWLGAHGPKSFGLVWNRCTSHLECWDLLGGSGNQLDSIGF